MFTSYLSSLSELSYLNSSFSFDNTTLSENFWVYGCEIQGTFDVYDNITHCFHPESVFMSGIESTLISFERRILEFMGQIIVIILKKVGEFFWDLISDVFNNLFLHLIKHSKLISSIFYSFLIYSLIYIISQRKYLGFFVVLLYLSIDGVLNLI